MKMANMSTLLAWRSLILFFKWQIFQTPVNTAVILAAAEGIIKSKDRTLLLEYGWPHQIDNKLGCVSDVTNEFVKRRGSTKAKKPT